MLKGAMPKVNLSPNATLTSAFKNAARKEALKKAYT